MEPNGPDGADDWSDLNYPDVAPMNQRDRSLERLLNLYFELVHTPVALSAAELRRRVPGYAKYRGSEHDTAFRRAFERDKDTLRSAGIPLDTVPIPGTDPQIEGYRIELKGDLVEMPDLTPEELAALRVAAHIVRVGDTEIDQALWRLGGVIDTLPEEYGLPLGEVGSPLAELEVPTGLVELQEARRNCVVVRFGYKDSLREVEPLRVFYQRGWWYLTGYDRTRLAQRHFRVDRMTALDDAPAIVTLTGEHYDPDVHSPVDRMVDPWAWGQHEPVLAQLLVDPGWAMSIVPGLPPEVTVEHRDDGSALITMEVRNREGFRWLVLGLLDHAVILGPDELRSDLQEWLHQMIEERP